MSRAAKKPAITPNSKRAREKKLAALLAQAPLHIRRSYQKWLAAVTALDAAPCGAKRRIARVWARRLGVQPQSVWSRRSEWRKQGNIILLDKRQSPAGKNGCPAGLPPLAVQHLRKLAQDDGLTLQAVAKLFSGQLARWQGGDASARIPGYDTAPKGRLHQSARQLRHA
ncbi:MAG TPA: hypothetical protein VGO59_16425 [Verrucomicrobiae bacterium]|jgi:hypothetical protein